MVRFVVSRGFNHRADSLSRAKNRSRNPHGPQRVLCAWGEDLTLVSQVFIGWQAPFISVNRLSRGELWLSRHAPENPAYEPCAIFRGENTLWGYPKNFLTDRKMYQKY